MRLKTLMDQRLKDSKPYIAWIIALLLLFVIQMPVNAVAPTQDRFYSTYSTLYSGTHRYSMNCYGYALQVYCLNCTASNSYKQTPGEFYKDSLPFTNLQSEYENAISSKTLSSLVSQKILNDFSSLGWTISLASDGSQAPAGKRKIALAVDNDLDFHFYLQHGDGTWSHKRGTDNATTKSIDSGVQITNSNIAQKALEGGYSDALYFYTISKDSVTDYPHSNGHSSNNTATNFLDISGDIITKCTTVTGNKSCRFDFSNDKDFYLFKPTSTKTYTIKTSLGSGFDVDGAIYDQDGNLVVVDYSTNNASFSVSLTAGRIYYIAFWDAGQHVAQYTLQIS